MDASRLTVALLALAVLVSLALLTWIAVRVEQGFRRPLAPPLAPPFPPLPPTKLPEPCRRLHVADLPADWTRLRSQRLPSSSDADDPPFPPRR